MTFGNGVSGKQPDFSIGLKEELSSIYQRQSDDHSADEDCEEFVEHIVAEGRWILGELEELQSHSTRSDQLRWLDEQIRLLERARKELITIPPDIDAALGVNVDPKSWIDETDLLLERLTVVKEQANELITPEAKNAKLKGLLDEMAIRVLNTLDDYGIKPMATADHTYFGYESAAVSVLVAISKDLSLPGTATTWRDRIAQLKRNGSLNQS